MKITNSSFFSVTYPPHITYHHELYFSQTERKIQVLRSEKMSYWPPNFGAGTVLITQECWSVVVAKADWAKRRTDGGMNLREGEEASLSLLFLLSSFAGFDHCSYLRPCAIRLCHRVRHGNFYQRSCVSEQFLPKIGSQKDIFFTSQHLPVCAILIVRYPRLVPLVHICWRRFFHIPIDFV